MNESEMIDEWILKNEKLLIEWKRTILTEIQTSINEMEW